MSYTLISESFPFARTDHVCIWCGQRINAGQRYRRERSVFNGEVQSHKWHLECDAAFDEVIRAEGGEVEFSPYSNERPAIAAIAQKENGNA